jgi:hypothetical protein
MELNEVLKKQLKLVMENDILSDIVLIDNKEIVSQLLQIIKLQVEKGNLQDFLIVFLDNNNFPKAVVSYDDAQLLVTIFQKIVEEGKENKKIIGSNLKAEILKKFGKFEKLNYDAPIGLAIEKLRDYPDEEVLIIVNEVGRYIGKIRRKNFTKNIRRLLN